MTDVTEIALRHVGKRYGLRWALCDVSCAIAKGQRVMLRGPNGAGKTTLLKLVAGALAPTRGEIEVGGLSVGRAREAVRARVGLLSHASGHYEDLTGFENAVFHARLLGLDDARARDALAEVGLGERGDLLVRHYSAGMKKRLALARIVLKAPEVVLLDEPFGELDPEAIDWVEALIGRLAREGRTIVLSTHFIAQGERLCDTVLTLEDGRLQAA